MRHLLAPIAICLVGAAAHAQGTMSAREIKAKAWFNNPVFRLHDERDVLLLFFSAKDKENSLAPVVQRLRRVALRPDVVVIALTADGRAEAQRFIQHYKVRFTVGAASASARDFGIKRTPTLLRLVRKPEGLRSVECPADQVEQLYLPAATSEPTSEPTDEAEPWELILFIQGPTPGLQRSWAINKLFRKLAPEEFLEFADEILSDDEASPDVRNRLEFYKRKLAGQPVDDQVRAPSMRLLNEFQANRDDPVWAPVKSYLDGIKERSVDRLVEDYWQRTGESPENLLIRYRIVSVLPEVGPRERVRQVLIEMLPFEPDFAIRGFITSGLVQTCPVGDTEVAELLEAQAEVEPNIYHVRPWMQAGAVYLRTGKKP